MEKICENLIRFIALLRATIVPMYVGLATWKPEMPMFVSSLSCTVESLNCVERVVYTLLAAYITVTWWCEVCFMTTWLLCYVFSALVAIHDLKLDSIETFVVQLLLSKTYNCNASMDRSYMTTAGPMQFAETYRCLQLLQKRANDVLKLPLATIKVLFLLGTIRCTYGVVKTSGLVRMFNLNAAIGFDVFLAVTFKALGEVYEKSKDVLIRERKMLNDKWFRRFHRSFWPLKFEVGGLYFVDPLMSLTMGSFVVLNVTNLLILGN